MQLNRNFSCFMPAHQESWLVMPLISFYCFRGMTKYEIIQNFKDVQQEKLLQFVKTEICTTVMSFE